MNAAAAAAAAADDEDAGIAALYARYDGPVRAYLRRRVGPDGGVDPEDLASEFWLRVISAQPRYPGVWPPPPAWLWRVAHNLLIDHLRACRARPGRSLEQLMEAKADHPALLGPEDLEASVLRALDAERALTALERLDAPHRAVLTLRYLDDLSVPETADRLGRSYQATKSLQARACRQARAHLTRSA